MPTENHTARLEDEALSDEASDKEGNRHVRR